MLPGAWSPDRDTLELVYGLLLECCGLSHVHGELPICSGGATEAPWGRTIYTDGSGLASSSPELRRCGWSAVELGPSGLPLRAVFGALPGRRQSVPRAERFAIFQALRVGPVDAHIVSDHLSAVREGSSWDRDLASSGARHANVWRMIFGLYGDGDPAPTFEWTPAHREWDDVVSAGSPTDIMNFLGNAWADFFARLGSESHAVADTVVKCQAAMIKRTQLTFDFLARFSQAIAALAQELPPPSPEAARATPRKQSNDHLALTEHTLFHFPALAEWRCSVCNLYAKTPASLAQLRTGSRRVCGPSTFQRWKAKAVFADREEERFPVSSAAVAVAMEAAEEVLGPEPDEGRAPPATVLQERFKALGHVMEQVGRVLFCASCSAFTILPNGNLKGLGERCNGRSKHPSTRSSQATKIKYAARGLHPKTGKILDPI